jgi:hypothetical protein
MALEKRCGHQRIRIYFQQVLHRSPIPSQFSHHLHRSSYLTTTFHPSSYQVTGLFPIAPISFIDSVTSFCTELLWGLNAATINGHFFTEAGSAHSIHAPTSFHIDISTSCRRCNRVLTIHVQLGTLWVLLYIVFDVSLQVSGHDPNPWFCLWLPSSTHESLCSSTSILGSHTPWQIRPGRALAGPLHSQPALLPPTHSRDLQIPRTLIYYHCQAKSIQVLVPRRSSEGVLCSRGFLLTRRI